MDDAGTVSVGREARVLDGFARELDVPIHDLELAGGALFLADKTPP